MDIKGFWDKAIEHYCISGKPDGSNIFIPISLDSLEHIYNGYLDEIIYHDKIQIEGIVADKGGITASYYLAAKKAHQQLEFPSLCPFLRFSILTMARFQECDFKKSFWASFNNFVSENEINPLPNGPKKTNYVQNVLKAIRRECRKNKVNLYCKNIYGENTTRVNVGVIFAHAMFNADDIKKVKRALYENGFAYDTPINYLDTAQIQETLECASIKRALDFFANGTGAEKELVYDSLKRWLENWEPNEEEEISLTNTNKSRTRASRINLSWVWILENPHLNRQLKRQAGFIVRNSIGEEGTIALRQGAWIDLSKGYGISDREHLYFIEGYNDATTLYSPELNKHFAAPLEHQANQALALRMVSSENHEPLYFYQETRQVIPFWDEKIFLATPDDIPSLLEARTPAFRLSQHENIYFYRIREDYEHGAIRFVKSDSSAYVAIKGVTAGINGKKAFLARFQITLQLCNIYSGSLRVTDSEGKISAQYTIEHKTGVLSDAIILPELEPGKYLVSVSKDGINIAIDNDLIKIEFEIVASGTRDSRQYFPDVNVSELPFTNAKYRPLKPDTKWIVLDKTSLLDHGEIEHKIFDFYFKKFNDIWRIYTNRDLYFACVLTCVEEQDLVGIAYQNYPIDMVYRPSPHQEYNFRVKAVYDATLSARINSSFYVYPQFLPNIRVNLWCFYFELMSFHEGLKVLFPDIKEGAKTWIISNYSMLKQSDKLIKIVTQKYFPF
jgi:hypothetical protein